MSKTMLAVVKPKAAPGMKIREVKVPSFARNEVLVKVKVASICGTDLHIYEWDRWAQNRIRPPLIPGQDCGQDVGHYRMRTDRAILDRGGASGGRDHDFRHRSERTSPPGGA